MTTPTEKDTLRHGIHMKALAKSDSANAYGQATVMLMGHAVTLAVEMYKEGVKAERERCKNLVVAHLRTNTYDGNDALVFKTTIEEVVGLLSDKQPPMPCKECKQPIEPRKHPCGKVTKNDTYCSNECRLIARKRYSTWSWKRIVE